MTTETAPRILWKDAAVRRVHPRRNGVAVKVKPMKLDKAIAGIIAEAGKSRSEEIQTLRDGKGDAAVAAAIVARVDGPKAAEWSAAADFDLEDGFQCVLRLGDREQDIPIPEFWQAQHGLGFILDLLMRGSYFRGYPHLARQANPSFWRAPGVLWSFLRRQLAVAPEAEYAALLAVAEKAREGASPDQRCNLAYAFPDRPEWALEEAATCRKRPLEVDDCRQRLFASLTDVDLVTEMVRQCAGSSTASPKMLMQYWYSILDNLGPAAVQPLKEAFARISVAKERKSLVAIVTLIESVEAAELLATLLPEQALRAEIFEYYTRVPQLAKTALAPLGTAAAREVLALLGN